MQAQVQQLMGMLLQQGQALQRLAVHSSGNNRSRSPHHQHHLVSFSLDAADALVAGRALCAVTVELLLKVLQ